MVATRVSLTDIGSYGVARSTVKGAPLSDAELKNQHAFWRAANYLALGMIYLQDNPLLREKLKPEHIKPRMLGHWGTSQAITHCTRGISIWGPASNDQGQEPDVVMACAGDTPTQEALAATALLRNEFPDLKIRFVNVVDLFKLQSDREHPHGLSDRDFDSLFTVDKPIVFPWLSMVDTPASLHQDQSSQPARAGLQRTGQHQHAHGVGDQ